MKPKKKVRQTKREVFVVLGEVKEIEGRKRFVPASTRYFNDQIARQPVGKILAAQFSEYRSMRSADQLRYHWVLVGYIASHTGHSKSEVHDALMRLKYGTTTVEIGGRKTEVRRSMADTGDLEKWEVVELIEYDLEICRELDIRVPTREELGYLPG